MRELLERLELLEKSYPNIFAVPQDDMEAMRDFRDQAARELKEVERKIRLVMERMKKSRQNPADWVYFNRRLRDQKERLELNVSMAERALGVMKRA